ncbi:MAG: endopeptidase La, partial [Proteobacteria bacterium]
MNKINMTKLKTQYSVLPLRDVVVFPGMVVPLFVGRDKSIEALKNAMNNNQSVILVAQKDSDVDDPTVEDVYDVGTLSAILQMVKLQDNTYKVLIEGQTKVQLKSLVDDGFFKADYVRVQTQTVLQSDEDKVFLKTLKERFKEYQSKHKKISSEVLRNVLGIDDLGVLADTIAAHLMIEHQQKQNLLEINQIDDLVTTLLSIIEAELDLLVMEKKIRGRVKGQIEKNQREYYLNEQIKAIKKELSDIDENNSEYADLELKIKDTPLSEQARKKVESEFKKLQLMPAMSAEATVVRNYLETILGLPWEKRND